MQLYKNWKIIFIICLASEKDKETTYSDFSVLWTERTATERACDSTEIFHLISGFRKKIKN